MNTIIKYAGAVAAGYAIRSYVKRDRKETRHVYEPLQMKNLTFAERMGARVGEAIGRWIFQPDNPEVMRQHNAYRKTRNTNYNRYSR